MTSSPSGLASAEAPKARKRLTQYFHPIARSEDVTPGLNVFRLLGEDVLVYRNADGRPVAFQDLCIHRGTRLSLGDVTPGGTIRCAYHGWEYDETGGCVRIPSLPPGASIPRKARIVAYATREAYGVVWVALEDPVADVPRFPNEEWNDPDWRGFLAFVQTWASSAGRVLENFCDWAHLPWVHENLLGTRDRAEVKPYDIWETDLQMGHTIEQDEPLGPEDLYSTQLTRNVFVVTLPFSVHLNRQEPEKGHETMISMSVAPVAPKLSTLYLWISRNHTLEPEHDDLFRGFSETVFSQDRRIVESQRPEEIPLDLRDEMHLKVPDAFSLVYRRLLSEYGEEGHEFLQP
jgi:phenylpropionate dioxygenase-like ring-hydroxylating dioxygenase large terminal subunit